jgi:thioredoxin reductase
LPEYAIPFILRSLGVSLDSKDHVVGDPWQRTNIPHFLAIGDISSPLKMIVTAVAQAAVAAHEAYVEVRSPYWK